MGDPITQGVLGVGMSLIGGDSPSVSQTDPNTQIAPEPQYESDMRQGLTSNAMKLLSSGMSLQDIVSSLTGQIPGLTNQTILKQQSLASGQLPLSYQTNFEKGISSGVQNTVGNIVNGLARRGVGLNGTSFTNQLNSVNQSVANAAAQSFNTSMNTASNLAAQPLNTSLSSGSSLSQMGLNMLQAPYNLYNTWRNTRYGNKADTIVDPGSSPPLAGVGSALLKGAFGV
jgi:hypothetical protein